MKKYQQAMALLARFPLWKGKAKETEMHVKKKSPFSNASIPVEPKNMSHILERKEKNVRWVCERVLSPMASPWYSNCRYVRNIWQVWISRISTCQTSPLSINQALNQVPTYMCSSRNQLTEYVASIRSATFASLPQIIQSNYRTKDVASGECARARARVRVDIRLTEVKDM